MNLTIVSDSGVVGIDGYFFDGLDLSQLDANIHAVQWYEHYGEIEYKNIFQDGILTKPSNKTISDISDFEFAINAWNVAKQKEIEFLKHLEIAEAEAVLANQTDITSA